MSLTHLLDTNTCIYIINRRPPHVAEKFAQHPPDAVGLSSITLAELRYGVTKSGSAKNAAVLEAFIQPLEIVPFDAEATRYYGSLRSLLEKQGTPIGAMDLLIAAHALALGVTLVTNNVREFERVEGLELENWF
ncbi:MAG: type II toxin-antitoxin system VapC family toxin [Deinococcus sp.]|uniref:type II toxin-antitoxin system tRNA(fMet)-specific endonuclease VapC n=1 Tax=Deinococcus sp. TaxID=47478 RepID=UPI0026DBE4E4|nr:type II toxin-antitoxin system VapC family toxin [Deinococcus sp.]MDO4244858.1 type II toxin-antitoxin system VapC family toxin [Deinococcus sp.]